MSNTVAPICLVRGSINCDEYYQVKSIALPGETISSIGFTRRVGGKGANQAVALARSLLQDQDTRTATVQFVGNVGEDYGAWLREEIQNCGVDVSTLDVVDIPTGRAVIQVAEDGENSIILFPGSNFSTAHEDNWITGRSYLTHGVSHVLLQNEIAMSSTQYLLENLPPGIVTIFNPSPLPSAGELLGLPWKSITWLILNEREATQLYNTFVPEAATHPSGEDYDTSTPLGLLKALSSVNILKYTGIVMTLGSKGLIAMPFKESEPLVLDAADLHGGKVLDTTGAGDCFTGYFVGGLLSAWIDADGGGCGSNTEGSSTWRGMLDRETLTGVLEFASQAAGMSVLRRGTIDSYPMRWEVEAELEGFQGSSSL